MPMQEKGRDEVKRNLSENIGEERNANEEKGRDEVKWNLSENISE